MVSYEGAGGGEMADSDFEVSSEDSEEESDEDMEVRLSHRAPYPRVQGPIRHASTQQSLVSPVLDPNVSPIGRVQ